MEPCPYITPLVLCLKFPSFHWLGTSFNCLSQAKIKEGYGRPVISSVKYCQVENKVHGVQI